MEQDCQHLIQVWISQFVPKLFRRAVDSSLENQQKSKAMFETNLTFVYREIPFLILWWVTCPFFFIKRFMTKYPCHDWYMVEYLFYKTDKSVQ